MRTKEEAKNLDSIGKVNILQKMKKDRIYEEGWLLRHTNTNCTIQDLNNMVEDGLLLKLAKKPSDFMSDNRYIITESGWHFAQNK